MARPKKNTNTQALADKMRKAVLQAAIEGKLTEQDATKDGNARELLAQIETEKQRLIKAGEIKRQKSLPDITEEEKPFDIPDNWEWVRLGELITSTESGKSPKCEKTPVKDDEWGVLTTTSVQKNYFLQRENKILPKKFDINICMKVNEGDLLITRAGPSNRTGVACVVKNIIYNLILSDKIVRLNYLSDLTNPSYLMFFINSSLGSSQTLQFASGMDKQQVNLSQDKIKNFLIAIPPLAEQQRIVAKLEEVMPQLDDLSADENALYALQTAFPRHIQASLLQAAIEGKLTQQDATKDGHTSDLLAEIESEKQRLFEAGEINRQKTLPPIIEEEKPFDVPDNWEWVRLGELTYNRGQKKPDTEFSYIDIASIDNKTQSLNLSLEVINPSQAPSRARKIVNKGDIIYATVRPYLMNITIIDRDIEPEPIVSTGFAILTTPYQVTNEYLFHVLMSPHFDTYANHSDNSKGVAYPAINDSRLMNGIIPLPPLAEQQRIVDLLEQVLPEIQTLKDI